MFDPEDEPTLGEVAGLEIEWEPSGTPRLATTLQLDELIAVPLESLRPVALDAAACHPLERIQYRIYQGVARRRERERLAITGLRYDLTWLSPQPIGRERAKMVGHLHARPNNSSLGFPEVIEVLSGRGCFFLQTLDMHSRAAPFCVVVEANPGDKVIIPPNLHHLAINGGREPLLFASVVAIEDKCNSQSLADLRGAAWYRTVDQGWIRNPSYRNAAELEWWHAEEHPDFCLTRLEPLYKTFVHTPECLMWMLEPIRFPDMFPDLWSRLPFRNQML